MKKSFAEYLLLKTEHDYNKISEHFSNKRSYLTPDIVSLKKYAQEGDFILDLGCGNGRLSEIFENNHYEYCGIDSSTELIKIAKKKYPKSKFAIGNGLKIPFNKNFFNIVYSLAVLHHIPSVELRKRFLVEIKRVLKPGGMAVITVWDISKKPGVKSQIIKEMFKKALGFSELDYKDVLIPFRKGGGESLADRYVHSFSINELRSLAKAVGFEIVHEGKNQRGKKYVSENLLIILRKKLD